MKIELIADVDPGSGAGPEFTAHVESSKFDQTDVDKVVDSLKTWIKTQQDTTTVPVNFKILADGILATEEQVTLRSNDVSVVSTATNGTMRARKILRDA